MITLRHDEKPYRSSANSNFASMCNNGMKKISTKTQNQIYFPTRRIQLQKILIEKEEYESMSMYLQNYSYCKINKINSNENPYWTSQRAIVRGLSAHYT